MMPSSPNQASNNVFPFLPFLPNIIYNSSDTQNYSLNYMPYPSFYYPFPMPLNASGQNYTTSQIPNHLQIHQRITGEKLEKCRGESISIIKTCNPCTYKLHAKSYPIMSGMKIMMRSKPLTLFEALEAIIKYKKEYQRLKEAKQKYVSQTACKNLNLNKKTIDDYQMYLRLGIHFNIIKKENLNQSFGAFRREVKSKRIETNAKWAKPEDMDIDEFYQNLICTFEEKK